MKANELMTGDWVLIKRTPSYEYPYKICSINNYSILGEDYADWIELEAGEEINLEDIKPIPLTKEILKKNGFRQVMFDFVLDMMHIRRDENVECFYIVVGGKGTRIDYVHELQHALRLCGINKEIVL